MLLRTIHFPEFYRSKPGADYDFFDSRVYLLLSQISKNCVIMNDADAQIAKAILEALNEWPVEHSKRAAQLQMHLKRNTIFRQSYIQAVEQGAVKNGCNAALTLYQHLQTTIDGVAAPSACLCGGRCDLGTCIPVDQQIRVDLPTHQDKFEQKRSGAQCQVVDRSLNVQGFVDKYLEPLLSGVGTIEIHDRYLGRAIYSSAIDVKKWHEVEKYWDVIKMSMSKKETPPPFRGWRDIDNFTRTIGWICDLIVQYKHDDDKKVNFRMVTEIGHIYTSNGKPLKDKKCIMAARIAIMAYQIQLNEAWRDKGVDVSIDVRLSFNGDVELDHVRYFIADHVAYGYDRGLDMLDEYSSKGVKMNPIKRSLLILLKDQNQILRHNRSLKMASLQNIEILYRDGKSYLQ